MSKQSSVLVVDDSPGICQTMSMILKRKGFDVYCAGDGPDALKKIKEKPFDVVLLDIRLPGMDGVEVHKKIRSMRPDARVAMMTAYSLEDRVREALDEGAETVFYKPLDMDAVIGFIEKRPRAS
jgi:two-component system response regulator (stage 0 sporulation protein F)